MTVSTGDADVVEDWEVDELLRWSSGLDFDVYWKDWQTIATSDLSEAPVCKLCYYRLPDMVSKVSKVCKQCIAN